MPLSDVLSPETMAAIDRAGALHFHRAGPAGAQVDYSIVVRRQPTPYDSFSIVPAHS